MRMDAIGGVYTRPLNLQELRPGAALNSQPGARSISQAGGKNFSAYLGEQVNKVNGSILKADQAVADVTTGKSRNLHEMMLALNKADLSLRMLTKVRNKAVDAYMELMRLSI